MGEKKLTSSAGISMSKYPTLKWQNFTCPLEYHSINLSHIRDFPFMLLAYLRLRKIPVINRLVEERETAYSVFVYIWNYFYTIENNPFLESMLILSFLCTKAEL